MLIAVERAFDIVGQIVPACREQSIRVSRRLILDPGCLLRGLNRGLPTDTEPLP
jgi:hypothetical protein